jgi:hypothetical protein
VQSKPPHSLSKVPKADPMSSVGKPNDSRKMFPRQKGEEHQLILGKPIASSTKPLHQPLILFLLSVIYHINGRRDELSIARAAAPSRSATTAHPRRKSLLEPHRQPKIPRARPAPPIHISNPPAPFTMPIIRSIAMQPDPLEPRALAAPRLPRFDCLAGHERPLPSSRREQIRFGR